MGRASADTVRAAAWASAEQLLPAEGRAPGRQACYRESAALGLGYFRSMSTTSAVAGFFFLMGFALADFHPWTNYATKVVKYRFLSVDGNLFAEVEIFNMYLLLFLNTSK